MTLGAMGHLRGCCDREASYYVLLLCAHLCYSQEEKGIPFR